jgi:hypothetical protein
MDVLPRKEKKTTLGMALGGRPARRRSIHQTKRHQMGRQPAEYNQIEATKKGG